MFYSSIFGSFLHVCFFLLSSINFLFPLFLYNLKSLSLFFSLSSIPFVTIYRFTFFLLFNIQLSIFFLCLSRSFNLHSLAFSSVPFHASTFQQNSLFFSPFSLPIFPLRLSYLSCSFDVFLVFFSSVTFPLFRFSLFPRFSPFSLKIFSYHLPYFKLFFSVLFLFSFRIVLTLLRYSLFPCFQLSNFKVLFSLPVIMF